MTHHVLDAKHLLCPMPVIKTQDKIKALGRGDTLEVVFTDPGALHDIPAWARVNGHQVVSVHDGQDEGAVTIAVHDDVDER